MGSHPGLAVAQGRFTELRGRVVVITGASSGIGRATARAFAECGARLVLAARNAEALRETAYLCAGAGVHTLVVPADVTDADAMAELARKSVDAFGRIDVWINNAGVGLFGPFTNAGVAEHRRVVEINLFGTMNGAAAVLPRFLAQGHGVLITNISIGGFVPVPFAAAYTAGKFGMRGFMAALRQEVADTPGIRLCSVFPGVIDTPGYQHGRNVSGKLLKPGPPIYPPEKVAAAMVELALRPQDELSIGWPTRLAKIGYGLAPRTTERVAGVFFRGYLKRAEEAPRRAGNLFAPSSGRMTADGGWRAGPRRLRRRDRLGRSLAWAGLAGVGVALVAANLARPQRA
ncbi:MAG TPA: SDR family oxidoreductase [Opitutus sp.]|nr:SDR family oxidoreductase [Opitutus sp.]